MYKVIVSYFDYNPNDINPKEKIFTSASIATNEDRFQLSQEVKNFIDTEIRPKYIPGYHLAHTVRLNFIKDDVMVKHHHTINLDEAETDVVLWLE